MKIISLRFATTFMERNIASLLYHRHDGRGNGKIENMISIYSEISSAEDFKGNGYSLKSPVDFCISVLHKASVIMLLDTADKPKEWFTSALVLRKDDRMFFHTTTETNTKMSNKFTANCIYVRPLIT